MFKTLLITLGIVEKAVGNVWKTGKKGVARGDRAAAGCIDWAAKEYNELHARARRFLGELEKRLDGAVINPEIKILCAFGGDVYDRVNPFRWHESKCWEDERRG